jgi:hypothetical protein
MGHAVWVFDETVTTDDLLDAWRHTVRAAELAERLARLASETASQAEVNAVTAEEVAVMAEHVAQSAAAAAERARAAANDARWIAQRDRAGLGEAEAIKAGTRIASAEAHEAYVSDSAETSAR